MRYSEQNKKYIQFYDSRGNYCLASDGYLTFYPDRRKSSFNTSLEIDSVASTHIARMNKLGKDFKTFKVLTRYEWQNLK